MSNISSKALSSFKYVYLIIFFALLSGFFHPLITGQSFDVVIYGIFILFQVLLVVFYYTKLLHLRAKEEYFLYLDLV